MFAVILTAVALAAGLADGRPAQIALVRMAPGLDAVAAERVLEAPAQDGPGGQLLLVPLQAPPLAVMADVEEEEQDKDDEYPDLSAGDVADFFSSLFGVKPPGAEQASDSPLGFFADMDPLTPPPAQDEGGPGDGVVVLRLGRSLKSVPEPSDVEPPESRVLEDLARPLNDDDEEEEEQAVDLDLRRNLRQRRALRLVVRQVGDGDGVTQEGRADATTPAPGSFLETVQNQLPGQLQGLGGAMEESKMIVGTFQAVIMPGSAATDMGQQIQGFISNMPQIPQIPAGG